MTEDMLVVRNVFCAYGKKSVLEGVDLTLPKGALLTLLGRNGAGKSTLLNCIAGLLKPKSGQIYLAGRQIAAMNTGQIARIAAYVSQNTPQTYRYTVLDYVVLGRAARLGIMQKPGRQDYKTAERALETLGIGHLAESIYMETSGGEKQLATIAKALAQEPELILFDEPTSALDYGNAVKILSLIADLSLSGYTVIMTTHNPEHPLLLQGSLPESRTAILYDTGRLKTGNTSDIVCEKNLCELYHVNLKMIDMPLWQRKVCAVPRL